MWDVIKAVQNTPAKNGKCKKSVKSSDSDLMEKEMPKPPKKNPRLMAQTPTDSDADLPRPPKRVVKSALNDEGSDTEEDLPPKKGAKKNKGKGKETQEPPINIENKAATVADQSCGGNIPQIKDVSCFPLYPLFIMSESLLSLNETTLYYYFLSDRTSISTKEKFSTGINHWAATIPDNAQPGNLNKVASASALRFSLSNRSGSCVQVPALTNATSRSSNASVLSSSIKISQNVVTGAHADKCIEVVELGLEDDDKTMCIEREAAFQSPPKGKTRVSSTVIPFSDFLPALPPFTIY